MARSNSPALRYWLLLGLALHIAAGLLLPRSAGPRARDARATRQPALEDIGVELVAAPFAGDTSGDGPPAAPATDEVRAPAAPAQASAVSPAALVVAPHVASNTGSAGASERAITRSEAASSAAPSEPGAAGSQPEVATTPPPPRLTLDALGVGARNPFITDTPLTGDAAAGARRGTAGSAAAAARRLESSIDTALAKRDQRIGLGAEGPVIAQLEQLVMQSSTAPNADATLFVRTDAEGKLVHAEVQAASGDGAEWERIVRELLRALGGQRTRVPAGSNGVSYKVRISSREQLPSGAAPGLEVNMLGITLKKGRGDNATKISILEPSITTKRVPLPNDPAEREVTAVVASFSLLGLLADPVDIGAPARRVVRAHITDLTVH